MVGSKTNKGSRVMFQSEPLCPPDVPADVSGRVSLRADKLNSLHINDLAVELQKHIRHKNAPKETDTQRYTNIIKK